MKNSPVLIALLFSFLFITCKKVEKDVHNYFPEVHTDSAWILSDGSVAVKGTILKTGTGDLYFAGFCLDTLHNPDMLSNQGISADSEFDGYSFYYRYRNLDATKKYYVRSWAVNSNGYVYGNEIPVPAIHLDTSQQQCHPPAGSLILINPNNVTTTSGVSYVEPISNFAFRAKFTNSVSLDFTFGKWPVTGIYTTWDQSTVSGAYVSILYNDPNSSFYVESGAKVYVTQVGAATFDITVCAAKVPNGYGGYYHFTTNFRSPQ